MFQAVITADIINSRKMETRLWLDHLKEELRKIGKEPEDWEIFRGDSLQLITSPKNALRAAIELKTAMMQHKCLDVRIGIGIGEISYRAEKITESNGTAFVYSGTKFDTLNKDETIGLKSPWKDFDESMNLVLALLGRLTSAWNTNRALIVREYLEHPHLTQRELGEKLNKQQSNISHSLNKACYDELRSVLDYYESNILKRIQ